MIFYFYLLLYQASSPSVTYKKRQKQLFFIFKNFSMHKVNSNLTFFLSFGKDTAKQMVPFLKHFSPKKSFKISYLFPCCSSLLLIMFLNFIGSSNYSIPFSLCHTLQLMKKFPCKTNPIFKIDFLYKIVFFTLVKNTLLAKFFKI